MKVQQQQQQQPSDQDQQQTYLSASNSSVSTTSRGLNKISDSLLRCTMNSGSSGNDIGLLNNQHDDHHQHQHQHHLAYMNSIPGLRQFASDNMKKTCLNTSVNLSL